MKAGMTSLHSPFSFVRRIFSMQKLISQLFWGNVLLFVNCISQNL